MHDDPIDLTPLDPDSDPGAEERFVSAVMSRIRTSENPYPARVDVLWGAWSLARPVMIAASVIIIVGGVFVARAIRGTTERPLTVAEAVGVPPLFRDVIAPGGSTR